MNRIIATILPVVPKDGVPLPQCDRLLVRRSLSW